MLFYGWSLIHFDTLAVCLLTLSREITGCVDFRAIGRRATVFAGSEAVLAAIVCSWIRLATSSHTPGTLVLIVYDRPSLT